MNVLVVIPARGGSKGIPQKNMRLLGGKPLVAYPVENAISFSNMFPDTDIVVTSEDKFIQEYVKQIYPNIFFVERSENLARDDIILDPVVYDALVKMEKKNNKTYDFVVTLVPTMPLLSLDTIKNVVKEFMDSTSCSLVLVSDATHIYWRDGKMLTERKNRQFLTPVYEECGGIIITNRSFLHITGRIISDHPFIFVCPEKESVDVNNWSDLVIAEKFSNRKKIGFCATGNFVQGIGHVHRMVTLALRLFEHEIVFLLKKKDKEAVDVVESFNFRVVSYNDADDFISNVEKLGLDAVIHDAPDGIDPEIAIRLMLIDILVISINEPDAFLADMIINPEFEFTGMPVENYLSGWRYNIIREDVMMFPIKECPDKIRNIVVTMGGSDPNGVTLMVLNYLKNIKNKKIKVIVGKYFSKQIRQKIREYPNVEIINDARFMGGILYNADLVITSNSSNVYNCVALGAFTISISKAREEMYHLFPRLCESVCYLGYYKELTSDVFKKAVKSFDDFHERMKYYNEMLPFAETIRENQSVIIDKINKLIK